MALIQADVVGPFPIVDARTGKDVMSPGTVVLDDEVTNVSALLGVHVTNVRPYAEPEKVAPADKAPAKGA